MAGAPPIAAPMAGADPSQPPLGAAPPQGPQADPMALMAMLAAMKQHAPAHKKHQKGKGKH